MTQRRLLEQKIEHAVEALARNKFSESRRGYNIDKDDVRKFLEDLEYIKLDAQQRTFNTVFKVKALTSMYVRVYPEKHLKRNVARASVFGGAAGVVGGGAGGALAGAAIGAAAGSFFPVVGNIIGGVAGAIIGGVGGGLAGGAGAGAASAGVGAAITDDEPVKLTAKDIFESFNSTRTPEVGYIECHIEL